MIATALHEVQERIEATKARVGRTDSVTLVAVTKNHPVEAVQEVAHLGVRTVGENRVQEAKEKMELYQGPELQWHLIGQLQNNKVRNVVGKFRLIHCCERRASTRSITTSQCGTRREQVWNGCGRVSYHTGICQNITQCTGKRAYVYGTIF